MSKSETNRNNNTEKRKKKHKVVRDFDIFGQGSHHEWRGNEKYCEDRKMCRLERLEKEGRGKAHWRKKKKKISDKFAAFSGLPDCKSVKLQQKIYKEKMRMEKLKKKKAKEEEMRKLASKVRFKYCEYNEELCEKIEKSKEKQIKKFKKEIIHLYKIYKKRLIKVLKELIPKLILYLFWIGIIAIIVYLILTLWNTIFMDFADERKFIDRPEPLQQDYEPEIPDDDRMN
ncbi:hypothetical protein SNEBB_006364 [Seison nebaliae]|nr:hypothetical protein SNEBB_006364 [Seison nebaliae]